VVNFVVAAAVRYEAKSRRRKDMRNDNGRKKVYIKVTPRQRLKKECGECQSKLDGSAGGKDLRSPGE
jgi:hypothetical protein